MKQFTRVRGLPDMAGRADYISNPDRQERIVAKSAPVDWQPYIDYERSHRKSKEANNEGREVVIAIPNAWSELPEEELARRVQLLAETAVGKDKDLQWAVHWNKTYTNLHVHVIFSERQREKNPGCWDRDIYHTADGKVARKKADRAKDADGKELPPVHRKGDLKDGFTAKDPKYATKAWVHTMKQDLRAAFEKMGVVFDKPELLHEYHEGNGSEAPIIHAKNEIIRANNAQCKAIAAEHNLPITALRAAAKTAVKQQEVLHLIEDFQGAPAAVTVPLEVHKKVVEIKATMNQFEEGYSRSVMLLEQIRQAASLNLVKKAKLKKQLREQGDKNGECRDKLYEWGRKYLHLLPGSCGSIEEFKAFTQRIVNAILLTPEKIQLILAQREIRAKLKEQEKPKPQEKKKSLDEQIQQAPPARSKPQPSQTAPKKKTKSHDHGGR